MGRKGQAALAYLPPVEIVAAAGSTYSIESFKAALNKVAQMQEEETADGTYSAEKCLMDNPFSSCTWDIVVAIGNVAGDYQLTFDSESISTVTAIGRPALASRRAVDIAIVATTNEFTVRSAMAAVNFVEMLEDRVAETGTGSTGDGTYTDTVVYGNTPFESFTWTIAKAGNVYTLTPTANS